MQKHKAGSEQWSFLEEERACDSMGACGRASGRLTKFLTWVGVSKAVCLIMTH